MSSTVPVSKQTLQQIKWLQKHLQPFVERGSANLDTECLKWHPSRQLVVGLAVKQLYNSEAEMKA